jgi:hypothetical protein
MERMAPRPWNGRTTAFALLLGIALAPAVASAQSASGGSSQVTAADLAHADALYREGNSAYDAGETKLAYEKYAEAFRIKQSFDVAGNLGNVELALGKMRAAAEHLAYSFRQFPANGDQKALALTASGLAEARKHVGELHFKITPEGADVAVDGNAVGRAPFADPVFVDPGTRTIQVSYEGYALQVLPLDIAAGASRDLVITLERPRAEPMPAAAAPRWPLIVGGVLAVGGIAVGVGFTVAANGKSSHANDLRAALPDSSACARPAAPALCGDLLGSLKSVDSFTTGAVIGFAVGGAAAVATLGYALFHGTSGPAKSAQGAIVRPTAWFTTKAAGAGAMMTF